MVLCYVLYLYIYIYILYFILTIGYDVNHKEPIEETLTRIKSAFEKDEDCTITHGIDTKEVPSVVKKLKHGKKRRHDNLSNEHLKFGGINLIFCWVNLFNPMHSLQYMQATTIDTTHWVYTWLGTNALLLLVQAIRKIWEARKSPVFLVT